jgi:hypothetical protein
MSTATTDVSAGVPTGTSRPEAGEMRLEAVVIQSRRRYRA